MRKEVFEVGTICIAMGLTYLLWLHFSVEQGLLWYSFGRIMVDELFNMVELGWVLRSVREGFGLACVVVGLTLICGGLLETNIYNRKAYKMRFGEKYSRR